MADLNRPKIIIPTGCANGAVVIGTGADIVVHTLVSGTQEVDAVTVEAFGTTAATVKWPATDGTTASITGTPAAATATLPIIDRWIGNGGGNVIVNGATTVAFKVSVERYMAGSQNEPAKTE